MDRAPEVKLSPPLNTEFKDASYEEWKAPKPPAPPVPEEEEELELLEELDEELDDAVGSSPPPQADNTNALSTTPNSR